MKLKPYFKEAILEQDWTKICKVYKAITGEEIEAPKIDVDKIKLSDVNMDEVIRDDDNKRETRKVSLSIPTKRQNLFVDKLDIAPDELVTKKPYLGVANPRPREKAPSKQINVVCSICNGKFKVFEGLATGWSKDKENNTWKCNDCCTESGRRKIKRRER